MANKRKKEEKENVALIEAEEAIVIRPQEGPQERFLACDADIVIYGGAAFGGKTWALLFEMGRWASTIPGYTGVIFRRSYPEITNPGALWDESLKLLPHFGGVPTKSDTKWTFPNGSWIKFSYLSNESDVAKWQGAQLAEIGFDEGTHFSSNQVFYMISRLRSNCGFKPALRITCNPDPNSWLAEFLAPWIDDEGYARHDVGRKYMGRISGNVHMGDTEEEVKKQGAKEVLSCEFIPALATDNKIGLAADPSYMSKLESLTTVDRARLKDGNWKILAGGGSFFKREWFKKIIPVIPKDVLRWVRYWDRAATEPSEENPNPDWTRGCLIGIRDDGPVIADMASIRTTPGGVKAFIKATAHSDGKDVEVVLEEDPGQAGVVDIDQLTQFLQGFIVGTSRPTKAKAERAKPLSSQAEAGNVTLVQGPWLKDFLREAEAFCDEREVKAPVGYKDDQIDAASGGYNYLCSEPIPTIRTL